MSIQLNKVTFLLIQRNLFETLLGHRVCYFPSSLSLCQLFHQSYAYICVIVDTKVWTTLCLLRWLLYLLQQDSCPWKIGRSLLPPQGSGTLYPTTSHLFLFSAINWRHFYFKSLILTLFCSLFCAASFVRVAPQWCWSFLRRPPTLNNHLCNVL